MSRLLLVVVAALAAVGAWAHGAAHGYEQGKAQATAALRPRGAVVVDAEGRCELFTGAVPLPATPHRALFVTLLVPDEGR